MLSRQKQTNKKNIKKKTKTCLAWQLDEVRGATRYSANTAELSQSNLQIDSTVTDLSIVQYQRGWSVKGSNQKL